MELAVKADYFWFVLATFACGRSCHVSLSSIPILQFFDSPIAFSSLFSSIYGFQLQANKRADIA